MQCSNDWLPRVVICVTPSEIKLIYFKEGLYRIWCGVNSLGDSGVNTLGDTSAFVNPTVQLLLTRRGKLRMYGVGIVFEFYNYICSPFLIIQNTDGIQLGLCKL